MRKYKVTVILPDEQLESTYAVEIEAHSYGTQATQGAGMIADFYENGDSKPFATFARVLSVQRIDSVEDRRLQLVMNYYGADGELHTQTHRLPEDTGPEYYIDLSAYTRPDEDQVILTKDEAQYLSNLVTQPGQFTEGNRWVDMHRKLNG